MIQISGEHATISWEWAKEECTTVAWRVNATLEMLLSFLTRESYNLHSLRNMYSLSSWQVWTHGEQRNQLVVLFG